MEGLAVYDIRDAPPGVSLSLFVSTPGEKPVEQQLDRLGR
jgi:hypothetical protein